MLGLVVVALLAAALNASPSLCQPADRETIDSGLAPGETTPLFLSDNECGFDTADNSFDTAPVMVPPADNDTVWFYGTNRASNCGAPDNMGTPCEIDFVLTANRDPEDLDSGPYLPFHVWYTFKPYVTPGKSENTLWMAAVYFNFNQGANVLVGTMPCLDVPWAQASSETLPISSRCAFGEQLWRGGFYKYYRFFLHVKCAYSQLKKVMNFNIDMNSERNTETAGWTPSDIWNMVSFEGWTPPDSNVMIKNMEDTMEDIDPASQEEQGSIPNTDDSNTSDPASQEEQGSTPNSDDSNTSDTDSTPDKSLPRQPPVRCSGNTCTCGSGGYAYTITGYRSGQTDTQVTGCGSGIKFSVDFGLIAKAVSVDTKDDVENREACCARCGMNLEAYGYLREGYWRCDNRLIFGIYLVEGPTF